MKILVINAGSSSLKFTVYSMTDEKMLAAGQVERLGTNEANLIYKRADADKLEFKADVNNHDEALGLICKKLVDSEIGVIDTLKDIEAIGHRVVHGGEQATKPVIVDSHVKDIIHDCFSLAPLHNPPNMAGIDAAEELFPGIPNIAVFDTAFHQTMPPESYLYAVPYELYTKYGIRRYGFHGTSHNYVARATARLLDIPYTKLNLITCHLGNGCSMAAISKGVVMDTTMGMTPLEGLVMGTRCGDIDPAVVIRLVELGMSAKEIDQLLNKKSGLLGVGGIGSSDMRDIIEASEAGDKQAMRAMKMFVRRVVKYIGSYFAILNGADALVFTGGIGEYSSYIRKRILEKTTALGLTVCEEKNNRFHGTPGLISTDDCTWKAIVMPTNEELMIAREVVSVLKSEETPHPAEIDNI